MLSKISLSRSLLVLGIVGVVFFAITAFFLGLDLSGRRFSQKPDLRTTSGTLHGMSYHTNIFKATEENKNFRQVLFTGPESQLVVMNIPPGGEVGEETHRYTEQTLFFLSGAGEGMLNDEKFPISPGDVVVVTAGTKHDFRNIGTQPLKIYTVYAPPNHIDGRIHATKADADADIADEAIGEQEPLR